MRKNRLKILLDCPLIRVRKSHMTPGSTKLQGAWTLRSIILRRALKKYEYLGEKEIKNETILTQWSLAQAGSNDEKNWG